MTVKFRDHLSAEACVIVSVMLQSSTLPSGVDISAENAWPVLRRTSD